MKEARGKDVYPEAAEDLNNFIVDSYFSKTTLELLEPKILANRQSAARSKERKMRSIHADLEHKAQTPQIENITLSNEVAKLQVGI
ncbi:Transcription factor RF2a [Morella rubra]|uniref:Transcription factor RF2a n=1 Tax=Morella rubra TaxID=262757 RepID=A0A6A1VBX4_9ROSI|nr:Transcription factor RF2a [Morella rubra]